MIRNLALLANIILELKYDYGREKSKSYASRTIFATNCAKGSLSLPNLESRPNPFTDVEPWRPMAAFNLKISLKRVGRNIYKLFRNRHFNRRISQKFCCNTKMCNRRKKNNICKVEIYLYDTSISEPKKNFKYNICEREMESYQNHKIFGNKIPN